ncbi:recombinase family protein [Alicyclobacillus shizuokensis]|uniref:recombinase family protein n=1 Tax=Alicyclobacillus shizuokensis TaxID=392014 RepID=UPI000829DFA1
MIGIYARTDLMDMAEIERQLKACRDHVGRAVYQEYVDCGASGDTLDCPGFQALLNDIQDGTVSTIVCVSPSCLSHDPILIQGIKSIGIQIQYVFQRHIG